VGKPPCHPLVEHGNDHRLDDALAGRARNVDTESSPCHGRSTSPCPSSSAPKRPSIPSRRISRPRRTMSPIPSRISSVCSPLHCPRGCEVRGRCTPRLPARALRPGQPPRGQGPRTARGKRCSMFAGGADAKNLPELPIGLDLAVRLRPEIVKFVRGMTAAPPRRGPVDFTAPTVVIAGSARALTAARVGAARADSRNDD
jgi:hypothetical protein